MHETDVALLNEIGELESVIPVFMGDLDDEAQIRNDQFFRRSSAVRIGKRLISPI
jgi:hypothetical protein